MKAAAEDPSQFRACGRSSARYAIEENRVDLKYTLTDYAYKYRSDAPVALEWGRTRHELVALGNETVACQLVFQADGAVLATLTEAPLLNWRPAPRLRIAVGELSGPGRGVVEAAFVGTVPVDRGDRLIADPLLREQALEVPAGCPQAVWLSLRLPAGAPPGRYTLPIALYQARDFEDEEAVGRAEVALELAALSLPEPHDFQHYLDLWQHPSGLARGHGVPLWSEAHWQLIEAYGRELARLGQKAITIIASDAPWAGQSCRRNPEYPSPLHEYNIVGIARGADGGLRFDFSRLDRYVETYLQLGIDREIEVIGLLAAWDDEYGRPLRDHPDNIRLACHEADGRISWLRSQAELCQYMQALRRHLVERGWWERTRFTADEPSDAALFRQRLEFLGASCPGAKAKAPFDHVEVMEEFVGAVADCVPILNGLTRDVAASRRLQQAVKARGGRFLWYVCCGPARPNNFIASPAIEGRFQGWFTAWAGLDGFLRWAFTCWPADPWRRPGFRFASWPSGDMFFVYPGKDGRPVRTIRTEMLLAGIQDFELLALARERAKGDPEVQRALEAALARVVRAELEDFCDLDQQRPETLYSLDPADYEAARRMLIEALG